MSDDLGYCCKDMDEARAQIARLRREKALLVAGLEMIAQGTTIESSMARATLRSAETNQTGGDDGHSSA